MVSSLQYAHTDFLPKPCEIFAALGLSYRVYKIWTSGDGVCKIDWSSLLFLVIMPWEVWFTKHIWKKRKKRECPGLDEKTIEAWPVKQQFTQREQLKIEGNQAGGILVARRYFLQKRRQLVSLPSVEKSSFNPLTAAIFRFFIFIYMSPYCRINHMGNRIKTPPSPPWQSRMLQLSNGFRQRSRAQTQMTRKVPLFFSKPLRTSACNLPCDIMVRSWESAIITWPSKKESVKQEYPTSFKNGQERHRQWDDSCWKGLWSTSKGVYKYTQENRKSRAY